MINCTSCERTGIARAHMVIISHLASHILCPPPIPNKAQLEKDPQGDKPLDENGYQALGCVYRKSPPHVSQKSDR